MTSYFKISPRVPKDPGFARPPLTVSSGHSQRSSGKKFSLIWKYCVSVSEEPPAPVFRVDRNIYSDCCQSFNSLVMISCSDTSANEDNSLRNHIR